MQTRQAAAQAQSAAAAPAPGASGPSATPPASAASTSARPALTVQTVSAKASQVPLRLAANGNIAAWQEASVGAQAQGLRIAEVRVDVGDAVRAGQVLALLASDAIAADLAQAQAQLAEAEVAVASATQEANRARAVQGSGAVAEQQVAQLLQTEAAAKARMQSAKALVQIQQVRMGNTRVLAPDSGVITARLASVGGISGGQEMFRLIRRGRLEWRAEVTSAELARIRPALGVQVTTAAGAKLNGKVRMVAPLVDVATRNALVHVDLQVPAAVQGLAKPGMFAHGEFELGSSSAITVPQAAVVLRDGFSYVFAVGSDKRVKQLKVQTGRIWNGEVEILSGVPTGARFASTGAGFLNDGDLVRVNP